MEQNTTRFGRQIEFGDIQEGMNVEVTTNAGMKFHGEVDYIDSRGFPIVFVEYSTPPFIAILPNDYVKVVENV